MKSFPTLLQLDVTFLSDSIPSGAAASHKSYKYAIVYLNQINDIKQGEFEVELLAYRVNQQLALYEAAKKRAALYLQRYQQLSACYAAWIYFQMVNKALQREVPTPTLVQSGQGRDGYSELVLRARNAKRNTRKAGVWTKLPALTL